MKTTLCVLFFSVQILAACIVEAQDFSNKGTDFWVIYTGHIDGTASRMALYITSDQNATGTVSVAGSTINFTVVANQVTTIRFTSSSTPSNSVAYNGQTTGIGTNKGIHIVSDHPVVVYSHILNSARSGSTLVLPTAVLGREYYVSSYKSVAGSGGGIRRSEFAIAATEDSTAVEITPAVTDANSAYPANVPFQVLLNKGDVFQYQSANDNDLTGSHIKSIATANHPCKPIAVFSGSTWTAMGCSTANSGDNLYQQLFPFVSWGKLYYTAPFINRSFDIFRILVQDPTTIVKVNGVALSVASLINGRYYETNTQGNNTSRIIEADKPICVFQYMITQNCDNVNSDPEMVILNSVDQTLNDITVMSARNDLTPPNTNITSHYLNIIFKTATFNTLKIDGAAPTSAPVAIPGTGYSYIQQDVTVSTNANPSHRITSDSGFICIAYGYGNVESYGYNAGTNVKDLYQFVSVQNQYATVDFPAACRTSPFYFSMTFPYQPTQIKWMFGGLFPDVVIDSPVYDSTWVINGRQLYKYHLPSTYSLNTIGTFPIKVIAQNPTSDGCSGEQEIDYNLQVYDRPVADFSFSGSGCLPDSVHFLDNTNANGRPAIKWSWDFADATASSAKNPVHKFSAPGSYNVKYSVITDIGCFSDTVIKTVMINEPPIAKFGVLKPYCVGKAVSFSDSSTSTSGTIAKWYWDFGDGSAQVVATSAGQSHIFSSTGTFNVTLKVESISGCQSTVFTKPVTINTNPLASFTFGNACLPSGAMQFNNSSTINDGTQNQFIYQWTFGDGGSSTQQNPTHSYNSVGPFTATLLVTSNNGCTDDTVRTINTIYAQPLASFNAPIEVCTGSVASFADQSIAANSSITQWKWDFGDGASSTQQNPNHTYNTSGNYLVSLTVTSAIGCISTTAVKTIIVNPLPVPNFYVSAPNCVTKDMSFTDASTSAAGNIIKWSWDLDDGTKPVNTTNTPFTHSYSSTGVYNVSLKTETEKGCINSTTKQIAVSPLPLAGFIVPDNCVNDPFVQFADTSSIADGTQLQFSYKWNFGDQNANAGNPNTSTLQNPQHRYTATGNYNVSLTVTSNAGCTSSITQPFTINGALPQSLFTINGGNQQCSNNVVGVINNSTVDFGQIVKLEIYWDYSNDPTNKTTIMHPSPAATFNHTYPEFFAPLSKTYVVNVVAYSGDNCLSSSTQTLTLKATPEIVFDPLPGICVNQPSFQITQASLANALPGNGVYSGPGISSTGVFDPQTAGVGKHTIRYTYSATNGCINFKEQSITVSAAPSVDAGPDRYVLEGGSAVLLGSGTGNGLSYTWTPVNGLNNSNVSQPTVIPTNDITYTLTVTSADGCVASDQVFVKVLKTPNIPNTFSPNGDGIHDKWEIQYLESYPGCTVEIYNRYGQMVFQSKGYNKPWDGTFKDKPLPAGTYYYIINPKNGRKQMSGFVDIIR